MVLSFSVKLHTLLIIEHFNKISRKFEASLAIQTQSQNSSFHYFRTETSLYESK